jgi:hypothetical protein
MNKAIAEMAKSPVGREQNPDATNNRARYGDIFGETIGFSCPRTVKASPTMSGAMPTVMGSP